MPCILKIKTPATNLKNLFEVESYFCLSTIIKKIAQTKIKYSVEYYSSRKYRYPTAIKMWATKAQFEKYKEELRLFRI